MSWMNTDIDIYQRLAQGATIYLINIGEGERDAYIDQP
jgi:hypothetical protein